MLAGPLSFVAREDSGWGLHRVLLYIGGIGERENMIAEPVVFKAHPKNSLLPDAPALHLNEDECRGLMDALWRLGVRPTSKHEAPETTGAMKEHLADLRRLIFERRVK